MTGFTRRRCDSSKFLKHPSEVSKDAILRVVLHSQKRKRNKRPLSCGGDPVRLVGNPRMAATCRLEASNGSIESPSFRSNPQRRFIDLDEIPWRTTGRRPRTDDSEVSVTFSLDKTSFKGTLLRLR